MASASPGSGGDERIDRLEDALERLRDEATFLKRRIATYLGDGIALTYLADDSPFFVNSTGYVGPVEIINGGQYEENNLDVLLSYLKPSDICVDVGANLGYFSLMFAKRLRAPGKVLAFEPHPFLCALTDRTLFHNGLRSLVQINDFGLSDRCGTASFRFRAADLGTGRVVGRFAWLRSSVRGVAAALFRKQSHLSFADRGAIRVIRSQVKTLDSMLPVGTTVNLIKIDVESHEYQVLLGMRRVLSESSDVKILFEKLDWQRGHEPMIYRYLSELSMGLFAVTPNGVLKGLDLREFEAWSGYVVAGRITSIGELNRSCFSIYTAQLRDPRGRPSPASANEATYSAPDGELLFHGPYWMLKRGDWRMTVHGELSGRITMTIAERFGRPVEEFEITQEARIREFRAGRDLLNFECVARARGSKAEIKFYRIEFRRIG